MQSLCSPDVRLIVSLCGCVGQPSQHGALISLLCTPQRVASTLSASASLLKILNLGFFAAEMSSKCKDCAQQEFKENLCVDHYRKLKGTTKMVRKRSTCEICSIETPLVFLGRRRAEGRREAVR
jgi:hypothetical protein